MNNYNSASENAALFRAAVVRASKLAAYANATSDRYSEVFEAVAALTPSERKPHIKPLISLFQDKLKRSVRAITALGELVRIADQTPDFMREGVNVEQLRGQHANMLAELRNLQRYATR